MKLRSQNTGFGLIETLLTLVILSTSILMILGLGLTQLRHMREDLRLNQLHMQVDALSLLISQHPHHRETILLGWQSNVESIFPHVVIQSVVKDDSVNLRIKLDHFCLQVVSSLHGNTQKYLSRDDSC